MQAERWKQVETLFEAAQQQPPISALSFCGKPVPATRSSVPRLSRC